MDNPTILIIIIFALLFSAYYYPSSRLNASIDGDDDENPYQSTYVKKDLDDIIDRTDYRIKPNFRQINLQNAFTNQRTPMPSVGKARDPNAKFVNRNLTTRTVSFPTQLNTGFQNDTDGKITFLDLDKPVMECPSNKILNGFKLVKEGNKFRYNYTCVDGADVNNLSRYNPGDTPIKYTEYTNINAEKPMESLQKQKVFCGQDGFINQLQLQRDSSGKKIRFKYGCSNVERAGEITEKGTGIQSGEALTTLKDHYLKCSEMKGIKGFEIEKSGEDGYQYKYKCQ